MAALQVEENMVTETVMSFPSLSFRQVKKRQKKTALRRKEYGICNYISWREYGQRVQEAAAGLVSAKRYQDLIQQLSQG
jgi:long-subunit acyl-CoA synthetase (AMP-forming)